MAVASATARGAFEIVDRTSSTINKITKNVRTLDRALEKTGKSLDALGHPQRIQRIERVTKALKGVDTQAGKTTASVGAMEKKTNASFKRMATAANAQVDRMLKKLRELNAQRVSVQVDLDTAKAQANLAALEARIKSLDTRDLNLQLSHLERNVARLSTSVGDGSGGGGRSLSRSFGIGAGRLRLWIGLMPLLLPMIVSLTGAITALASSAAMAAGGAGVLGMGGISALVVGISTLALVAKPANTALKELKQAQDDYNKSVQQYGRDSAQAEKARRIYNRSRGANPGAARVLNNAQAVSAGWRTQTKAARSDYFGILNEGLETANALLPTFGAISKRVLESSRRAVEQFLRPFRGSEWKTIFREMGDLFAKIDGPGLRAFGNFALWWGRISRAASPYVIAAFDKLESMTKSWANRASNVGAVQRSIEKMVGHLRAWSKLGGASIRLLGALISGGESSGKTMVERVTDQFDKWTAWLRDNPSKVRKFFDDAMETASKFAGALAEVAKALWAIGDALMPLLSHLSGLTSALGDLGVLQPLLAAGMAYGTGRLVMRGAGAVGGIGATGTAAAAAGGTAIAGSRAGLAAVGSAGYQTARAMGAGRLVAAGAGAQVMGSRLPAVGRVAGKVAAPIAIGLAGYDALTFDGSAAQRGQAALSSLTLGGIARPQTEGGISDVAGARAASFLGGLKSTGNERQADIYTEVRRLERIISDPTKHAGNFSLGGNDNALFGKKLDNGKYGKQQLEEAEKRVQLLRAEAKALRDVNRRSKVGKSADDIINAFTVRQNSNTGARKNLTKDYLEELKKLSPEGRKELNHAMAGFQQQLARGTKAQRAAAMDLRDAIVNSYSQMGRRVRIVNGQILSGTKTEWRGISSAIATHTEQALQAASKNFTAIQQKAVGSLEAMGFTRKDASTLVQGLESKNKTKKKLANTAIQHGPYGSNFVGPTPVQAVGGNPQGDGLGNDGRSATAARQSASGQTSITGSAGLMGAKPGLSVYADAAAGYGLRVSSGARPGSITSSGNQSYHSSGDALDLAGTPAQMMAFAQFASTNWGSGLAELIYTPLGAGQIKNGASYVYTGKVASDHIDHVHIADPTPGGVMEAGAIGMSGAPGVAGMGPRTIDIAAPISGLGGSAGAITDAASALYAAAVEQKVNDALASGVGAMGAGPDLSGAGGILTFEQVAALAESVGLPGVTFAQIAKGESGFNPKAVGNDAAAGYGNTFGLGLWQITTGWNDDIIKMFGGREAMFDPYTNALAAKAIYDRQGIGAWYGTKYMTAPDLHFQGDGHGVEWGGWHAKGGEFTAYKPTMIGVGEAGAEKITVTPLDKSGGPSLGKGGDVHISIEKIVYNDEGDIEKKIMKELEKVGRKLASQGLSEL